LQIPLNKNFDCIIAGAGIIGLSTAYEYLKKFPTHRICVLEKEQKIFCHQSGRNSGVIHSGIYYKPDSFKAKNCIDGYKYLIKFARDNNIPYEITGKLIVATKKNQIEILNKLYHNGILNGLKNIKLLNSEEALKIEPHCKNVIQALHIPSSGIIDYKLVGLKLLELIKEKGAIIKFKTLVNKIQNHKKEILVSTNKGIIKTKKIILCTGVFSDKFLSESLKKKFRVFPFKGEYYYLKKSATKYVNGLIYPVPDIDFPFLGVHLTKTTNNEVEAGPNAILSFAKEGYTKFSFKWNDFFQIISWKGFWKFTRLFWKIGVYEYYRSFSKNEFTRSIKELVPDIKKKDLIIGKNGIRSQIMTNEGKLMDDFLVDKNNGIYNVINAPSPAATSSFAIAKNIINQIKKKT
jgi:L-2-hydroxyglutarate oxidase